MKAFDLNELKKTARVKQNTIVNNNQQTITNNRSYSQIHKSPTKSSIRQSIQQSYYLSRWGKNIDGKINSKNQSIPWSNVGQGIISTSLGQQHVLILNNKYQCFGYGNNNYGQLGIDGDYIHRPTQINVFKQMKITNIKSGAYHSIVQNSKGQVYSFGLNMKGQLGLGCYQNRKKPSLIYSLLPYGSKNPKSNFFLQTTQYKKKLKKSKQQNNQLTNITNIMNKLNLQSSTNQINKNQFLLMSEQYIKNISCGPLHTLVLSNKNRLFACGYNQKYNIGNGKNKTINQFIQIKINKSSLINSQQSNIKIQNIQCGINTSGFLTIDGKLYITGTLNNKVYETFTYLPFNQQIIDFKFVSDSIIILNKKGQIYQMGKLLTSSNSISYQNFTKIDFFQNSIKQIFGGVNCIFAINQKGIPYGWGDNSHNQITALSSEEQLQKPTQLSIPIYLNESFQIISGNGTTFLLSGKPLDSPKKSQIKIENQEEISSFTSQIPLKSSVSQIQIDLKRKNTSKYSHSNIYKTQERNLITQMGIRPRTFNISMEIDFNQLVIQSQISQGGYGIIYKGLWRQTTVAIKMFKIQSQNGVKDFFSQCAAMQALRHPNIVMFLGACTKPPNFAIVLQYCGRGSLWSTIQNLQIPLTWQDRKRFALQTAKGINYLHTSNPPIIHRDLKSLNLLLDDSYKVKLADFGWTKGLDNYMTGKIGTYQWMAPQVIASQRYSQKADVFSYGIILWEIASRQPPFKNLSGLQVSMEVLNNDLRPKIPKNTPDCFVRLMKKCWDRQPTKRPSVKQIIKQLQSMKF